MKVIKTVKEKVSFNASQLEGFVRATRKPISEEKLAHYVGILAGQGSYNTTITIARFEDGREVIINGYVKVIAALEYLTTTDNDSVDLMVEYNYINAELGDTEIDEIATIQNITKSTVLDAIALMQEFDITQKDSVLSNIMDRTERIHKNVKLKSDREITTISCDGISYTFRGRPVFSFTYNFLVYDEARARLQARFKTAKLDLTYEQLQEIKDYCHEFLSQDAAVLEGYINTTSRLDYLTNTDFEVLKAMESLLLGEKFDREAIKEVITKRQRFRKKLKKGMKTNQVTDGSTDTLEQLANGN